jgi:hypothetical protein
LPHVGERFNFEGWHFEVVDLDGAELIRCWRFLPKQRSKALSDQLDLKST